MMIQLHRLNKATHPSFNTCRWEVLVEQIALDFLAKRCRGVETLALRHVMTFPHRSSSRTSHKRLRTIESFPLLAIDTK